MLALPIEGFEQFCSLPYLIPPVPETVLNTAELVGKGQTIAPKGTGEGGIVPLRVTVAASVIVCSEVWRVS